MASTRRAAREAAIKALFQVDLGGMDADSAFRAAVALDDLDGEAVEFARGLSLGTLEHQSFIDERIGQLSRAWAVSRLAAVDRAILRLAAYEIIFRSDIPASVSINEAVELAKAYSTPVSGRFVNGVLGALARAVRAAEAPSAEETGAVDEIVVPGDESDSGNHPVQDDFSEQR